MRALIEIKPKSDMAYMDINKHSILGAIYSQFIGTPYEHLHDLKKFKFFSFSDIFPPTDYKNGETKKLIVSSPDSAFVRIFCENIMTKEEINIKGTHFDVVSAKPLKLKLKNRFITGSPIVLYKDNMSGEYFSFKKHHDMNFFIERLKENAIKKYTAFYDEKPEIEGPIFDRMRFSNEVVVPMVKTGRGFIFIGTTWKLLEKFRFNSAKERKFYRFVMDAGIGEKTSMGFGLLNPLR